MRWKESEEYVYLWTGLMAVHICSLLCDYEGFFEATQPQSFLSSDDLSTKHVFKLQIVKEERSLWFMNKLFYIWS